MMEKTLATAPTTDEPSEKAEKVLVEREVARRRTLCLISHPDAGKTTVTEKLLLFGGAIQFAGTVKARKSKKYATSDWMEIEKQRGISVTASAMRFRYQNFEINLLDTPGHQDFLEETYRSITAVDSALMVIDAAKGVEAQTLKLFQVCKKQKIPVIAFINKLDREALSPFQLMEEIEKALGANTTPITWPIGQGKNFKGVYDILGQNFRLYKPKESENLEEHKVVFPLASKECQDLLGNEQHQELINDLALLEAAGNPFQRDDYLAGKLIPVFFGSAIHNFGLLELLDHYLKICPDPLPRLAKSRWVEPTETDFSAFVFKIQANMDPNHRDRIAFLRVCSGRFEKNTKVYHTRLERYLKIANPIFFMAEERELAEEAYAGDIIGLFDTGNFRIGDSLSLGEDIRFLDIPNFAPEYFALVKLLSPFKNKQLEKGLRQLSEEGSVQVFRKLDIPHFVLGVVGRLQFEVVKFRLQHEYSVELEFQPLSYQCARWVTFPQEKLLQQFLYDNPSQVFLDTYDQHIVLANSLWEMDYIVKKYPEGLFFQAQDINEQTRS